MKKLPIALVSLAILSLLSLNSANAAAFTDVPTTDPDYTAINDLLQRGITSGSNGNFDPERNLTRAEALKLVSLTTNFDCSRYIAAKMRPSFTDVDEFHSLKSYIACFETEGFINGFGDGTFHPQDAVLGPELLKILYRAAQTNIDLTNPPTYANFTDTSLTPYIAFAIQQGIFSVNANNEIDNRPLKRRDAARIIYLYLEALNGNYDTSDSYPMKVLDIRYLPTENGHMVEKYMENETMAEWSVQEMNDYLDEMSDGIVETLERGSIYRKDPAQTPSLDYQIYKKVYYEESIPQGDKLGDDTANNLELFYPNFNEILERENICDLVDNQGVREVWLWGYHHYDIVVVESKMAGPWGDISNSLHFPNDMPVCNHTYTLYNYNYGRGVGEATENHTHQIEVILNHIGRITNLPLFEQNFIGFYPHFVCFMGNNDPTCDESRGVKGQKQTCDPYGSCLGLPIYLNTERDYDTTTPRACGWTHYPPNARNDYDWGNLEAISSNCLDWHPDGSGETTLISCRTWSTTSDCKGDVGTDFKRWWMQSIPGKNNTLTYEDRPLRNWWVFIADFDSAMNGNWKLVE